ncbi:MAG: lytic polysaccharide monooxygenase [Defluviitaleaceae bacterium]|nr:lytic polysaccharide monooxygenase [Defluviitaleaceae bacterium]
MKKISVVLSVVLMSVMLLFVNVQTAFGHGWMFNDRAHLASGGGGNLNQNMGNITWEPQSAGEVNSRFAVEEGRVTLNQAVSANSGNIGGFPRMSDFGVNRFHRVPMTGGATNIQWWFTAPHSTISIVYYISRPGFNPGQPLNFADFDYLTTVHYHGNSPAISHTVHTHNITLPTDRSGAHVLLAAWHVADNNVSWYRVKDIYLTNTGVPTQPPVTQPTQPPATQPPATQPTQPPATQPTQPPATQPTQPPVGGATPFSGVVGTVYTQGQLVSYNGNTYRVQVTFTLWSPDWTPTLTPALFQRL